MDEYKFKCCPVCNNEMNPVDLKCMTELDASCIYQCSNNPTHKFWWHPFKRNQINLNPLVSENNWDTVQLFTWVNNKWVNVTTDTYISLCSTCNGTGVVETNRIGYDSIMGKCPSCKGNRKY